MKVLVMSRLELWRQSQKHKKKESGNGLGGPATLIRTLDGCDRNEITSNVDELFPEANTQWFGDSPELVPTVVAFDPAMAPEFHARGTSIQVRTLIRPSTPNLLHVMRFRGEEGFGDTIVIHHWTADENDAFILKPGPIIEIL